MKLESDFFFKTACLVKKLVYICSRFEGQPGISGVYEREVLGVLKLGNGV